MIPKAQLARHQLNFDAGRLTHVAAFVSDLERSGTLINFDWGAWHVQARELLDDAARCARLDKETTRKLVTFIVRLDRYKPGYLAEVARTPAFPALLKRLAQFCP